MVGNACLTEALKRLDLMRDSRAYQAARNLPKGKKGSPESKSRFEAFKQLNESFGFREFDLTNWVTANLTHSWLNRDGHLDASTMMAIASREFKVVQEYSFGKRGRPHFLRKGTLNCIDGRSGSGVRWKKDHIDWFGLKGIKAIIDPHNKVISYGLSHRVKHVQLVRRLIGRKFRYYAQLVCEGLPYVKERNLPGRGVVGLDLGPSTIAVVAPKSGIALLEEFCSELDDKQATIRQFQRQEDRQRRANNPVNYNSDGTIIKGPKRWFTSKRQVKLSSRRSTIQRKQAAHRKSLQGNLVNRIITLGDDIRTEKISYKSFQRNFGKSVGYRAPGMFMAELRRKARKVTEFPTRTTRLSQTCHGCGTIKKKSLSQRWHSCDCGLKTQRDLYSAFLATCVEGDQLNVDQALKTWPEVDKLLQATLSEVKSAIGKGRKIPTSFGLNRSQSGSSVSAGQETATSEILDVVEPACGEREPGKGCESYQPVTDLSTHRERLGDTKRQSKGNQQVSLFEKEGGQNLSQSTT